MNIEERNKAIANRIEEARGMTNDHKGFTRLVEHAATRIKICQQTLAEWTQRTVLEPTNAIEWASSAIEQDFELRFYMDALNILCKAEDDAQRVSRLKIKLDTLRGDLLTGMHESRSTSGLARAVGECRTDGARFVLRSFNELVRGIEGQG